MTKFTLTAINAITAFDTEIQEAILVHENSYEFNDQDVIIFGYSMNELTTDEEVEEVLTNETCPTYSSIREDGVYLANA